MEREAGNRGATRGRGQFGSGGAGIQVSASANDALHDAVLAIGHLRARRTQGQHDMRPGSIVEMLELGREDADDRVGPLAVGQMKGPLEIEGLSNYPRVTAEAFQPERIRQEDDALGAWSVLAFGKRPANVDARAEQLQIAWSPRWR